MHEVGPQPRIDRDVTLCTPSAFAGTDVNQCREPRMSSSLQDSFPGNIVRWNLTVLLGCPFPRTRLCWADGHSNYFALLAPFWYRYAQQRAKRTHKFPRDHASAAHPTIGPPGRPRGPFVLHLLPRRDIRTFEHIARIRSSCSPIPDWSNGDHPPDFRDRDATRSPGHTHHRLTRPPVPGEHPPSTIIKGSFTTATTFKSSSYSTATDLCARIGTRSTVC